MALEHHSADIIHACPPAVLDHCNNTHKQPVLLESKPASHQMHLQNAKQRRTDGAMHCKGCPIHGLGHTGAIVQLTVWDTWV